MRDINSIHAQQRGELSGRNFDHGYEKGEPKCNIDKFYLEIS